MGGASFVRRVSTIATALIAVAVLTSSAAAQNAVFSGRVTSAAGQPLGGASVGVTELGVGAVADGDGRYSFSVDVAGKVGRNVNVTAKYIGYKPKRLPITLAAGRVEHNFALDKDVLNLEEVVVTGTSEATSQKKTPFAVGVIDNTSLREVPAASPLAAISSRIPGASVISASGQPGSAPAIRLRSATSMTGRQDPLVILDGTISRLSLADINAEDIERIEVIKGAAASSMYGSDAANGVVQIFTKRGSSLADGQTTFTVRNEVGSNYLPRVLTGNMHHNYRVFCGGATECTMDQQGTAAVTAFTAATRSAAFDLISDNNYPVYYDQLRKVFRPGQFFTNYVSVGQRRASTNLNASFQNQHDAGVLRILKGYGRQNFRMNVDQALNEKTDVGMGAFYGRSHADQGQDYGIFFGLRFLEPNIKLDSIVNCGLACTYNGAYNPVIRQAPLSGNVQNPLYVLSQNQVAQDRDRFNGTFRLQYRPTTWLTGEGNVGYDESNQGYKFFRPLGYTGSTGTSGSGSLTSQTDGDRSYNTNLSLTSVRTFAETIRNISKIGFLYEDQSHSTVGVTATALTVPKVTEFAAANTSQPILPNSRSETIRAENVFFVTTFDIKDRYVLDGLVRQDKSSLFGADERTAVYQRLSGAWRVTEDFTLPGIDELKLRAGYGTAGLRPTFTAQYETFAIVGGQPEKLTAGNASLKPALSKETEVGFNVNFLKNYSLEYSYSKKTTEDQIIKVPMPAATGYQGRWENAGSLEGSTHEAALGAVILSKADYFWRINVTGDRTRQKISDLKVGAFLIGPSEGTSNTQIFRIAKGEPFGVIYGSRWIKNADQLTKTLATGSLTGCSVATATPVAAAAVVPKTCDATDFKVNEEGFFVRDTRCTIAAGVVSCSGYHSKSEVPLKSFICKDTACTIVTDKVQIGDVNPDFSMGFTTTAQWKGFGLNAALGWVKGGDIYNYTRQWPFNELRDPVIDQSGKPSAGCTVAGGTATPWTTQTQAQCPYSTGKKPTTYYSTFYNNFDPSDYFVEDGSYFRLRELSVNYNVPQKYVTRIPVGGFRTARLGIVGRNLWTSTDYSGYDPDVTGPGGGNPFAYRVDYFTYPAYRTFTFMLELGF